jgi:hypothetical protein
MGIEGRAYGQGGAAAFAETRTSKVSSLFPVILIRMVCTGLLALPVYVPRFSVFGLLFYFEDGGSTFLRNIIVRLSDYKVSHLRREQSPLCICLQYDSKQNQRLFA